MSYAYLQSDSNSTFPGSFTSIASSGFPADVGSGNFLFWVVLLLVPGGAKTISFSDARGWGNGAFVHINDYYDPVNDYQLSFGYVKNLPSGGAQTITASWSGAIIGAAIYLAEIAGIDTTMPFYDATESAIATQVCTSTTVDELSSGVTSGSALSFAPSMLVGFAFNLSGGQAPLAGTTFRNIDDGTWAINLASGATVNARLFLGRTVEILPIAATATAAEDFWATDTYMMLLSVFREDAPGPPTGPPPKLNFQMP